MKRFFSALTVLALALSLTACVDNGDGTATTTTTTTETAGATTTTTAIPEPQGQYNAFTGNYDIGEGESTRPIGFMVPNDSKTIGYQPHIDEADFYMECETEGAIPRLMAVFSNIERMPETFGPIRSARSPFVATARALGVIYVHCGGSSTADSVLKTGVLDRVNAMTESSSLFWRDSTLRSKIDYVHSLVTGRDKLAARIKQKGFSTESVKETPFVFSDKAATGTAAVKFQINTTPSHRATFVYDAKTGSYGKNIGKIGSYKAHKSLEGDQIQVSNVLVLYATKYVEGTSDGGTLYNFKTGTGTGYVFSGGTYREISYTRTDKALTLQETDGSAVTFAPGKIYMVLADKGLKDKMVIGE